MATRWIVAPAALLFALSGNVGAAPVTVTLDNGWWALGSGWGPACTGSNCDSSGTQLNVGWSINGGLVGTSFQLGGVGQSHTVRFGSALFAEENGMLTAGETDDLLLSAFLHFTSPALGLVNNTAQVAATVGPLKDVGPLNKELQISFDSVLLDFATGGQVSVDFSPLTWDCQGTNKCTYVSPVGRGIDATFTFVRDALVAPVDNRPPNGDAAINAVPEPSSLLLLGAAAAGFALSRRRVQEGLLPCPV